MHEQEHDPYGSYLDKYFQVRKDVGEHVDDDTIEDALFDAMGQKPEKIPEHLQTVHDFVRRSIEERKIPMNWVMQAEADTRQIMQVQKSIRTLGRGIGAKITCQSRGRTLSKAVTAGIEEKIGMGIVASILKEGGPTILSLLSLECFFDITVDIPEIHNNECLANISGSWKHPINGAVIPIRGTVTLQTPT